jgi:outer membrane protein TolC
MRVGLALGLLLPFVFSMGSFASDDSAAEKKVYTLEEAVEAAFKSNWALKAEREKIDQAIYARNQARADLLPKLSMFYGYRYTDSASREFVGLGAREVTSRDLYTLAGEIRQPLFTGFALTSAYELARLGMDLSQTELELAKLTMALRIKEAYFDILIADKAAEVAEKDLEARQASANVARSLYQVGMIPLNELLQAEVTAANSEQAVVRLLNDAKLARSAFNTILARPVAEPLDVEDILDYIPISGTLEEFIHTAQRKRPEIRAIAINILQADKQIRLARSEYFPEIDVVGEYTRQGDTPWPQGDPFSDRNVFEARAEFRWTFWEWGKTVNAEKQQNSVKNQLLKTKEDIELNISLDVQRAFLDVQTAEENIPTTQKAVEQGEEGLRVSEERYKAQVTIIDEVLLALTRLTEARLFYYRALYGHHLAKARLLRAMGEYDSGFLRRSNDER